MIVRRFTVAFFQIFTKGLIELFAEIGSAGQGKSQSQEKAIKYTGLAFTCTQWAPMHLYDSRTICTLEKWSQSTRWGRNKKKNKICSTFFLFFLAKAKIQFFNKKNNTYNFPEQKKREQHYFINFYFKNKNKKKVKKLFLKTP